MANSKWTVAAAVDGIEMIRADIEIKDGDKTVPHFYVVPGTLNAEGEPVVPATWNTPGVSPALAYERFLYAVDLKERASKRESVAVESTVIKVKGADVDLMKLKLNEAVFAINSARGLKAITGKDAGKAFEVAARKLLEAKSVVQDEKTGLLKVATTK